MDTKTTRERSPCTSISSHSCPSRILDIPPNEFAAALTAPTIRTYSEFALDSVLLGKRTSWHLQINTIPTPTYVSQLKRTLYRIVQLLGRSPTHVTDLEGDTSTFLSTFVPICRLIRSSTECNRTNGPLHCLLHFHHLMVQRTC